MKQTRAQKANHNFDNGNYKIFDENMNMIYFEMENGIQEKYEYDENMNMIYFEDEDGWKVKYDANGSVIQINDRIL